jgi:hypothetical protein
MDQKMLPYGPFVAAMFPRDTLRRGNARKQIARDLLDYSTSAGHFAKPTTPTVKASLKRAEEASFGTMAANKLVDAAFNPPNHAILSLLELIEASPTTAEPFTESFDRTALSTLSLEEVATFARVLHDTSFVPASATENQVTGDDEGPGLSRYKGARPQHSNRRHEDNSRHFRRITY